jgi:hypothetical protein
MFSRPLVKIHFSEHSSLIAKRGVKAVSRYVITYKINEALISHYFDDVKFTTRRANKPGQSATTPRERIMFDSPNLMP